MYNVLMSNILRAIVYAQILLFGRFSLFWVDADRLGWALVRYRNPGLSFSLKIGSSGFFL